MGITQVKKPFSQPFLSSFVLAPEMLPFKDREITAIDQELSEYEQVWLDPSIERNLISKNELLASFAISKAENSQLTFKEAQEVYSLVLADPTYDFIGEKLKRQKKLTQKDYDKLEFFNIAKTFRALNQKPMTTEILTPEFILSLHQQLTLGLDLFKDHLLEFTVYKSGKWRDNDQIQVGDYIPSPYKHIKSGVGELISWLNQNLSPVGIAIFHTALYGLHPFNNGNKRVCRILEHTLLRSLGLNAKNLYSTSYYYHQEKARYYKYLLYSLERKNLNHFVAFVLEAIVLSIVSVVKTSLEVKRAEWLDRQELEGQMKIAFRPLIKRREVQFKNLLRQTKGKMARQTLVTYLQKAVEQKVLSKREAGRATYYQLNFPAPEVETLEKWLLMVRQRLPYIPPRIGLI